MEILNRLLLDSKCTLKKSRIVLVAHSYSVRLWVYSVFSSAVAFLMFNGGGYMLNTQQLSVFDAQKCSEHITPYCSVADCISRLIIS